MRRFTLLLVALTLLVAAPLTLDAQHRPLTTAQVNTLNTAYGDAWKAPFGPYHQAPPQYNSTWWYVSPFTGPAPWENSVVAPSRPLPSGFESVFGPHPGVGSKIYGEWETNLEHFKGVGTPPGFSTSEINTAIALFEEWGLGTPIFYEGRYGWNTRFPNQAELWDFDCSVTDAVKFPHFVIAKYQVRLVNDLGAIPSKKHPWVPGHLFQ